MSIPFADHLGIAIDEAAGGRSRCRLPLKAELMNSNGVAHGGVPFALADTGMGATLKTLLAPRETCVTIELKINYYRPGAGITLTCDSQVVHKGRTIATVESRVSVDGTLMASTLGTRRNPA